MYHTVVQQAKFRRFVRLLRPLVPPEALTVLGMETVAVGLLERLWHAAMTSAKRGDIGRLSDEEIAEAVGWFGEPVALVECYVGAGWLDRSETYRLLVHDWHDHAPGFVHGCVAREGGFATIVRNYSPQLSVPNYSPQLSVPNDKHNTTEQNRTKHNKPTSTHTQRSEAQGVAQELFRRLGVTKRSSSLWKIALAVASGDVPRTVLWDCVDAAVRNATGDPVAYLVAAYLAETEARGVARGVAMPALPPGFGSTERPASSPAVQQDLLKGVPAYGEANRTGGGNGATHAAQRNGERAESDRRSSHRPGAE